MLQCQCCDSGVLARGLVGPLQYEVQRLAEEDARQRAAWKQQARQQRELLDKTRKMLLSRGGAGAGAGSGSDTPLPHSDVSKSNLLSFSASDGAADETVSDDAAGTDGDLGRGSAGVCVQCLRMHCHNQ